MRVCLSVAITEMVAKQPPSQNSNQTNTQYECPADPVVPGGPSSVSLTLFIFF